jgi:hypothetical protein
MPSRYSQKLDGEERGVFAASPFAAPPFEVLMSDVVSIL